MDLLWFELVFGAIFTAFLFLATVAFVISYVLLDEAEQKAQIVAEHREKQGQVPRKVVRRAYLELIKAVCVLIICVTFCFIGLIRLISPIA